MTTRVVNVRSAEWRQAVADGTAVYIGRRCAGFAASPFGNPWKVGTRHGVNRGDAVQMYREWAVGMRMHPEGKPFPRERVESLRGKVLGCWCHPEKCHGDVLVELLEATAPAPSA
jgi:hypothetical protein